MQRYFQFQPFLCISIFLVLGAVFGPAHANIQFTRTETLVIGCAQQKLNRLSCNYRLIEPDEPREFFASLDNVQLPIPVNESYPLTHSITSILFLIDNPIDEPSDISQKKISDLKYLIETSLPHHRIGLAALGKDLNLLSPLGSDPTLVTLAVDGLGPQAQASPLYHNLMQAIQLLAKASSTRKAIYLLGDGRSTSTTSPYEGEITVLANRFDIAIFTLGYPSSEKGNHVDRFKRLSARTGGQFVVLDTDTLLLPEDFRKAPYKSIDSGGQLAVDLSQPLLDGLIGEKAVHLEVSTADNKLISIKVPVDLPNDSPGDLPAPIHSGSGDDTSEKASQSPAALRGLGGLTPHSTSRGPLEPPNAYTSRLLKIWPWLCGLLVAAAAITYGFGLRPRRREQKSMQRLPKSVYDSVYLVSLQDESVRYPIANLKCRLGRGKDNDIVLPDGSVSRDHAEVKRNRDGSYTVTDLDSLNGVYVNDTKIHTAIITEGDAIDIGDTRLIFTYKSSGVLDNLEQERSIQFQSNYG